MLPRGLTRLVNVGVVIFVGVSCSGRVNIQVSDCIYNPKHDTNNNRVKINKFKHDPISN